MTAVEAQRPGPFGEAALTLWAAGWRGVLPLPPRAKEPPPRGYTGADGVWPSYADVHAWTTGREADGNVCLRLPHRVLGVDVDDYADKHGGATVAAAVDRWGPLPPTWRCTSRDDGVSGIALYIVPEHLAWPGELPGGDVELLQHRHRYAVCPPSIHPEGRRYRWLTPGGTVSLSPPVVDELPELPPTWVHGLTGGELAHDTLRAGLGPGAVGQWLTARGGGEPCRAVRLAVERARVELTTGGRHDAALRATMRLTGLARDHHRGVLVALGAVRTLWDIVCADPARGTLRDPDTAAREWASMLTGAVDVAAATNTTDDPTDPCTDPLHGLVPPKGAPSCSTLGTTSTGSSVPLLGTTGSLSGSVTATLPPEPPGASLTAGSLASSVGAAADHLGIILNDGRDAERALVVAHEVERERGRRAARQYLDDEQALRLWREPRYLPTLTRELAIPDEPVAYRVDQLMPVGANVLLAAQFKAGKTTTLSALLKALADHIAFLKVFMVNSAGRIAVWNYEVDERQYRRWLRDAGIENTDRITVLNLRGFRMPLGTKPGEDWAVSWLASHDIGLWALDPFARAFTGTSENDNTEVARFLDTLDVIKYRAGVSELVLTTHTGRAIAEAGAERARGATRLDDWADVRWLLVRNEDGERFFRATGRDVEVAEGRLDFDPLTRGLTFVGGSGRQAGGGNLQAVLMEAIKEHPGTSLTGLRLICRNMLGKATNIDIDNAVKGLVSQGLVTVRPGPRNASLHYLATLP